MNTYRAHVFSHVGNSRTQHQDNYLVGNHTFLSEELRDVMPIANSLHCEEAELQPGGYCAFVCDGMGGHAHGEVASLTAVQLLRRHNARLLQAAAVSTEAIQDIVSRMNYEFCQIAASKHEFRTMGTTLCGVILKDYHVYGVNIGDSRLYMYQEGSLKQITIDHTEGQRLQNLGFLTEDEVRRFPNRKAIYKHIGQRVNLRPDVFEIDNIVPGTILLLATDGLTDALSDEEICKVLIDEKYDLKTCGCKLIENAISRNIGFGDNITLILMGF